MIAWICSDCAKRLGGQMPDGHLATFHDDHCDVCERFVAVTEPRDWGLSKYFQPPDSRRKDFMRKELLRHVYLRNDEEEK